VKKCVRQDGWKSVARYVETLVKSGEMCGTIEIEAYALMAKQSIFVWSKDEGADSLHLISAHNRVKPSRVHLLYSSTRKHYELLCLCSHEHATASESSSAGSKVTEVPAAPLDRPDDSVRVSSVLISLLSARIQRLRLHIRDAVAILLIIITHCAAVRQVDAACERLAATVKPTTNKVSAARDGHHLIKRLLFWR
jgi:hypothetical protein